MRRARRSWAGPWMLGLALLGSACSEPEEPAAGPDAPEEQPKAPAPEPAADDGNVDAVENTDGVPNEPSVTIVEPGNGGAQALAERTAGAPPRRVVVQVKLSEGRRKALHMPVVRLAGEVALESIGDEGSRYTWTPAATTVLADAEQEGVDPEFLEAFTAALAVGEAPAAVALPLDRWDVVTELPWPPKSDEPHASRVAVGMRLALSHLALPIPSLSMSPGAVWQVHRRVDLFGIPAWQTLSTKLEKIEGDQIEVDAEVRYHSVEGEPIEGAPLGIEGITTVTGTGRLRARYDLKTALPSDMQLEGKLEIRTEGEAKPQRWSFELRADEDYMAHPDARVALKGEATQGGLVIGKAPPDTRVWFNKHKVMVSPEGDFLIGFGRDAPPRALLAFAFGEEAPIERHVLHVTGREFEPESIDGLPPEMVDLEKKLRKELNKSRAQIKRVRNKASEVPYYRDGFRWPMKGKLTSTYGRKRTLNGEDHGYHWGVDLAAPSGRKVKAPAAGVVVFAENDVPLSGNLVLIDHGHGLTSSFLHLDKIKVKVGDEVKAGQVIATSGNTGRSTGPHLDWRMNLFDTRIDPMTVVGPPP